MTAGTDFITRAHALWRVRMAQWQQRFGFFAKLVLLSGGAGAIIAPQFVMSAAELKVAGQCLGAKLLVMLGDMAGKFNRCALHAKADAQKRKPGRSGITYGLDFAFPAANSKTRRHQNRIQALHGGFNVPCF